MASQITSLTIVNSTVYLGADQRKHQSSATLAFVRGIHRGPANLMTSSCSSRVCDGRGLSSPDHKFNMAITLLGVR